MVKNLNKNATSMDLFEQKLEGAVAQYHEAYTQKHEVEPNAKHMQEVQKIIRNKYLSEGLVTN
jgi:hypothetical protein